MRKTIFILIQLMLVTTASAAVIVDIHASSGPVGPDFASSDSWPDYRNNSLSALESGSSTVGTGKSQYKQESEFDARDLVATADFESWRAEAGVAGEHGNSVFFSVAFTSNDTDFSLENISYDISSNNTQGWFDFQGDFSGSTYDQDTILAYDASGNEITSNNGSDPAREIYYSGVGVSLSDDTVTGTEQDHIDTIVDSVNSEAPFGIEARYTVGLGVPFQNATTVTVTSVPEPKSAGLLLGIFALIFLMYRRF